MCSAYELPPAPVETVIQTVVPVKKASVVVSPVERALVQARPIEKAPVDAAADVVKREKPALEEPEGPTMRDIFSEIQLLSGTGPNSLLIQVESSLA